uniref:Uncharacterized protein n=1 Tax=Fusarium oxysporum (strain Fo5176) TaxID=660025 RepID=A0A0D2XVX4_FUSOF
MKRSQPVINAPNPGDNVLATKMNSILSSAMRRRQLN